MIKYRPIKTSREDLHCHKQDLHSIYNKNTKKPESDTILTQKITTFRKQMYTKHQRSIDASSLMGLPISERTYTDISRTYTQSVSVTLIGTQKLSGNNLKICLLWGC